MPARRQTQSYLRTLFAQRGVAPKHRYGQNFLIDLNIHELIVKTAELGGQDLVLEVGPGAGAMTEVMTDQASDVIAIDIDPAMVELTAAATAGKANVQILQADILAGKNQINPAVLDQIRAGLAAASDRRLKLVANLPYNVATPVITNFLVHPELCPERIVVTIQLELAERMRAKPGTPEYGALSVLVQALTDFELVRVLSPSVFWPRPQVESAVVKIVPNAEKRAAIGDLGWFHHVVRRVFLHRRKNLRGVLFSLWRERWTKAEVDELLETLGLTGMIRAETMNVEEFIDLARALRVRMGESAEVDDGG